MKQMLVNIAIVASVVGQERPDFSGTWTYDATRSTKTTKALRMGPDGTRTEIELNYPPTPALGTEFTAKQDAKTLTLDLTVSRLTWVINGVPQNTTPAGSTTNPTGAYTVAYALDGSESLNRDPSLFAGQPETKTISTSAWNANTLVITTRITPASPMATTTFSLRFDSDGSLIVETTGTDHRGATPQTITTVYRRKR